MKREFKDLIRMESYKNLNSEITGDYDKTHAVKCINGTFVGIEENGVTSMTVYDCDFLHDSIDKVGEAKLIAAIVDGEEVYKA